MEKAVNFKESHRMKAFQVVDFDSPAQLFKIDVPQPTTGDVSLRIEACVFNFADMLIAARASDCSLPA